MWKFCAPLWLIEFVTYNDLLLNVVLAIWYGLYVSLSPVLPLSSSFICFICSFYLWMIWHSNAVWHIVSGLPAVQRLCGTSRALQGSTPEKLNVHRMCQAGSRKSFQWSLHRHYHYINVLLADEDWLNQICIFCIWFVPCCEPVYLERFLD